VTSVEILFEDTINLSENWDLNWRFGARSIDYTQELDVRYTIDTWIPDFLPQPTQHERVRTKVDSSGFGPEVGIGTVFKFGKNDRWNIRTDLDFSGIIGDTDSAYNDFIEEQDQPFIDVTGTESDRLYSILDFSFGFEVHPLRKLVIGGGYRFASWRDVTMKQWFFDDENIALSSQSLENVSFSGMFVSVGYRF
jgi:hypothetical protein